MSERTILEAITGGVKIAVAACSLPTLPIKFVDITFIPPDDQKYLEIVHIPNNPNNVTWGDEQLRQGFFRLILHWPKDGSGPYTPMDIIEEIGGYFTKNRWVNGVQIAEGADFKGSLDGASDLLYPVSVRYSNFVA